MTEIFLPQKEQLQQLFKANNFIAVYLFGSRVDGLAGENSDYDFGLLLENYPGLENASLFQFMFEEEATAILNTKVDAIILNEASIEQNFLIISRGVLVYSKDDNKRTDYEDIVIRNYLDFKPFCDLYRQEVRESIKEGDFYVKP